MGSNYSSGLFPIEVSCLINMDLELLRAKIFRFQRTIDPEFDHGVFITKKQFQFSLQLNDRQTYVLFRRFDKEGYGRIPFLDLWAALALASSADVMEKIAFIFGLMDTKKEKSLSLSDLEILLHCTTRGFSRLKGIKYPPASSIKHFIDLLKKKHPVKELGSKGDITMKSLRVFLMSNDLSKTYLTSLGTVAVEQESGKLIYQRAELLSKIASLEAEIGSIDQEAFENADDTENYEKERGGDFPLLDLRRDNVFSTGN